MKILIARMNHETNTFSPVPTPLAAFGRDGPDWGDDAARANRGMRTAMAAFLDAAARERADVVTPVSAAANPSGPVSADAYAAICEAIVAAAPGCDAVMLDLHGAMVAEQSADGEGDLLERVRAVLPDAPIAVALDLHANVTQKMIDHADVIVSFKTYPHVDMYETGEHAARLLFDRLHGRARPVLAWRQPPLMTSTLCSASAEGAMRRAVEAARAAEADGMLAVSVLPGFSLADIPAPCISVVVVGDGDRAAADAVAARIARQIWEARDAFVYRSAPLAESVAQAAALARGAQRPVLMLDHGDNCMSGGPCDTMDVLEEALAQRLDGIVSGPLCDPDAVAQLIAAGVGATVTVPVGNKRPSHGGVQREPFVATGIVRALTDGEYVITGPTYTGQRAYMGRTAVLDIGAATLVISERTQEPWDLGVFESVGIDPRRARFLLLKSRMYCRPVFVPIAAALVECDSRGVTSSDYALFRYARLARPVYPLDAIDRWAPAA
ncbi:MlrC domain-containing protein [Burkholderia multivorans]|uniref:M81 family metallopeptidase n=1 Tax=Burkholderia multivorans TaxID=87883 RepID=UPI0006A5A102|nr:M81 family metallopeptidase [Burkholderia multivorans]KOE22614.1 microcystin degradation protein MlrC [Burkholderia multivorans R-20526]MBU9243959.1 M81 family metallopeptidase [Burkholderia multivorans]MCL4653691.1 M81 family metallopeptidase [Burkholderia multivorans]MCL4659204.1 M81 family metallopeptidase [Burkholderia multivorans]MCO1428193.1 M81 family metallopeptidase [Burkholderia multivorans]